MSSDKLKDIIKFLKHNFHMKLLIKDIKENDISLIVMSRGIIDKGENYLLSKGIEGIVPDEEGKVKLFSWQGLNFYILSKEECG